MKTAEMLLTLLPIAEKLIVQIGGKLVEMNVSELSEDDLIAALEKSRSDDWPDYRFISPNTGGSESG